MKNKKIIEFVQKIKELEKEYNLQIVAENPFCHLLVKEQSEKKLYEIDGTECE